jgi:ABC-type Mn2+/Zn2+ transport system permease subunit
LRLAAAPLGSLLVWRKLAYFGDSLSHATLLGVAFKFVAAYSCLGRFGGGMCDVGVVIGQFVG